MHILLVDDNPDDRFLVCRELTRAFAPAQITEVGTATGFTAALAAGGFDVVITDYQVRWSNGTAILRAIKDRYGHCPVIMFTNTATQAIAIEAMKLGLDDYVIKSPSHYARLPAAVEAALERQQMRQRAAVLENRLQLLLNQLEVGIYRLTLDGTLLEANAAFLRLIGLGSLTQIPEQTLEPYFSPQDYAELFNQLRQNGEASSREIELRRADGTTCWVKISKTFIQSPEGTLIDGLIEDISDRKRDEAMLRQRQQHLSIALDTAQLGSWELDLQSLELRCSSQCRVNFGLPPEADFPYQRLFNLIHPDDREPVRAAIAQAIEAGSDYRAEYRITWPDGSLHWILAQGRPFYAADGTPLCMVGVTLDISDRKQAEQLQQARLQAEQQARTEAEQRQQRSAFLAEANRLLFSSLDCRTTLGNLASLVVPALADLCVIDLVKTTSLTFQEPIVTAAEPDKAAVVLELRRRYASPAEANYGAAKVLRTGQPEFNPVIPAAVYEQIAQDADHLALLQQIAAHTSIIVPMAIRDRKFGTIALAKTQGNQPFTPKDLELAQELARTTAIALDNVRLYEEAQEANQAKDEFLAVVSHELRNPLNSILGWTQVLHRRQFADPTLSRAIEVIERNTRLQNKLIEDLLDVSRIIQNQLQITKQPVDPIPIIDGAIEALSPTAQAKSIVIETRLNPAVGQVLGDAQRLEQIVGNLLSNAIKFTPNGGRVVISLEPIETVAQITITDTGQGIGAELLPLIFERFRQGDTSKTRSQSGLGLGLAIVRHLVELHGGTIYATSEGKNRGSTFTVQLPLSSDSSRTTTDEPAVIEPLSSLAGLQILVLDDDADNRELAAFVLEQQQATVISAASAAAAFDILCRYKIDALVSDIGMPDEDGYSFIRRVRTLPAPQQRQVPAIALSAFAKEEDRQAALSAGFQRHIAKPVNPDDLIQAIAELMSVM
jgi:PAS domain S-box-containing protein